MKLPVKLIDIIIIFLAFSFVVFITCRAYINPQNNPQVLIQGESGEWIFNINTEDETVSVQGPLGETIVRIAGSRAWVESSPCENQNCVVAGFIRRQGQWAACLPNQVLVMIKSGDDNEVDAITK